MTIKIISLSIHEPTDLEGVPRDCTPELEKNQDKSARIAAAIHELIETSSLMPQIQKGLGLEGQVRFQVKYRITPTSLEASSLDGLKKTSIVATDLIQHHNSRVIELVKQLFPRAVPPPRAPAPAIPEELSEEGEDGPRFEELESTPLVSEGRGSPSPAPQLLLTDIERPLLLADGSVDDSDPIEEAPPTEASAPPVSTRSEDAIDQFLQNVARSLAESERVIKHWREPPLLLANVPFNAVESTESSHETAPTQEMTRTEALESLDALFRTIPQIPIPRSIQLHNPSFMSIEDLSIEEAPEAATSHPQIENGAVEATSQAIIPHQNGAIDRQPVPQPSPHPEEPTIPLSRRPAQSFFVEIDDLFIGTVPTPLHSNPRIEIIEDEEDEPTPQAIIPRQNALMDIEPMHQPSPHPHAPLYLTNRPEYENPSLEGAITGEPVFPICPRLTREVPRLQPQIIDAEPSLTPRLEEPASHLSARKFFARMIEDLFMEAPPTALYSNPRIEIIGDKPTPHPRTPLYLMNTPEQKRPLLEGAITGEPVFPICPRLTREVPRLQPQIIDAEPSLSSRSIVPYQNPAEPRSVNPSSITVMRSGIPHSLGELGVPSFRSRGYQIPFQRERASQLLKKCTPPLLMQSLPQEEESVEFTVEYTPPPPAATTDLRPMSSPWTFDPLRVRFESPFLSPSFPRPGAHQPLPLRIAPPLGKKERVTRPSTLPSLSSKSSQFLLQLLRKSARR
ncbi:MAG: hypothetical protein KBC64_05060 [Simkaniaceae bacterium]|nr:hypothetical protein [Simkaniaceae bacterium]